MRIKEGIGDMITDEDLKRVIEAGITNALFGQRFRPGNYGGYDTIPSIVDEAVTKFVDTRVMEAASKWLTEHPEKIQEAIDRAINAGIHKCIQAHYDQRFGGLFRQALAGLRSEGGLPNY